MGLTTMLGRLRYDELSSCESRLVVAAVRRSSIAPDHTNHLNTTELTERRAWAALRLTLGCESPAELAGWTCAHAARAPTRRSPAAALGAKLRKCPNKLFIRVLLNAPQIEGRKVGLAQS